MFIFCFSPEVISAAIWNTKSNRRTRMRISWSAGDYSRSNSLDFDEIGEKRSHLERIYELRIEFALEWGWEKKNDSINFSFRGDRCARTCDVWMMCSDWRSNTHWSVDDCEKNVFRAASLYLVRCICRADSALCFARWPFDRSLDERWHEKESR